MKNLVGKKELIDYIAYAYGDKKKDVAEMVEKVFHGIHAAIVLKGGITMLGEFSIEVRERKERMGRNPSTGEPVAIPAHKVLAIKAGKDLQKELNS